MRRRILEINILLTLLSFNIKAYAQVTSSIGSESVPLLEIGVGAVVADVPDYPAAGHNTTHTVPFPAAIYRGEILRADEDGGVRGRFFRSERYELSLSFGGALPADSEDNPDREGMPDLDLMIEAGPALFYHFFPRHKFRTKKLTLSIPFRQAIMTDGSYVENRGVVFNPHLFFIKEDFLMKKLLWYSGIDARWGNRKYLETFYSVPAQFSNQNRQTFFAKSGYVGTSLSTGFSYLFGNDVTAFIGVQHSNYGGSRNQESPLFIKKNNTYLGVGLVWWFYKSKLKGERY